MPYSAGAGKGLGIVPSRLTLRTVCLQITVYGAHTNTRNIPPPFQLVSKFLVIPELLMSITSRVSVCSYKRILLLLLQPSGVGRLVVTDDGRVI
jgi:hypothetical protein